MEFVIVSLTGLYFWGMIFVVSTVITGVTLHMLKSMKLLGMREEFFRKRASLALNLWLGINLPFALFYMNNVLRVAGIG